MALEQYRAKRNFAATPEPKPRARKTGTTGETASSFVVQKARRDPAAL